MKKLTILLLTFATCATTSCTRNNQNCDVVKETYIHKYGVPVTKSDWEDQGKEGKVVALHKDGITVSTSYSKGVTHGPVSYSYPNSSTIHRVETYSHGELIALRENYPSGVPMQEELFEGSELIKLTRWYEDGTPQATEHYNNTFLTVGEYRTPLNVMESRIQDGHGTRICRTNDGELLSKDSIQNGQMIERVTFYSNGDPSTVTPFENGVVHGLRLTFLQGGLPNTVEQWVYGIQDGTTVAYQNGEKSAEIPYEQGKKAGTESRFRDGELLVEEVNWKDDVQHGQRTLYIDGNSRVEWYHHGEIVSRTTYERMNMPR